MRFVLLAIVAATAFGVYKTWNTETSEDLRAWASQKAWTHFFVNQVNLDQFDGFPEIG